MNPFKFGIVASTDTHLGAPAPSTRSRTQGPRRRRQPARDEMPQGLPGRLEFNPGRARRALGRGELARRALRRAATPRGVRHQRPAPRRALLRRLGLSAEALCERAGLRRARATRGACRWAAISPRATGGGAPRFAVSALRDPGHDRRGRARRSQRIQIVKGWLDGRRDARARRTTSPAIRANGADVDLATCEPRGPGADALCASGAIPTSIRRSAPSTTRACSRTRPAAGASGSATRRASTARIPRRSRRASRPAAIAHVPRRSRSAPGPRRSGSRPDPHLAAGTAAA